MRNIAPAVFVLVAMARIAHAERYDWHYLEPYLETEMTVAKEGTTPIVAVSVRGYPMPTAAQVALYVPDEPGYRVPPRSLTPYAEGTETLALAIVYPYRDAWVGAELQRADLARRVPRGSRVTVYAYGDEVEQRLSWSPIGELRAETFASRESRGANLVQALDESITALVEVSATRRLLLVISDDCDTSDATRAKLEELDHRRTGIESVAIVHDEHMACDAHPLEWFVQTKLSTTKDGFAAALARVIESRFANRWYATFNARWLRRTDEGIGDLVLDVGEQYRPRQLVSFGDGHSVRPSPPRALPSVRQLGLGALLVGLLALLARWRFTTRRPGA